MTKNYEFYINILGVDRPERLSGSNLRYNQLYAVIQKGFSGARKNCRSMFCVHKDERL
jgi:hypothetical protein